MENNNAVLIYTAEEENFDYSKATYERDGWGGGEYPLESNPRQYALMDSDRVYTDDNNIQRFMAVEGVIDPTNDYYCVALAPVFETLAAELSGFEDDQYHSGYTYKIEFIDEYGNKFYINVLKVDSKGGGEVGDFTPHDNLIEYITKFDSSADKKSYGVVGEASDDDLYGNLDYDLLFNSNNVKINAVYAYENGWTISGNYSNGYIIRDDTPIVKLNENISDEPSYEDIVTAITESVNATNLPQHEKDRIIEQMIKVFTGTKPVIGTIDPISDKVKGKCLGEIKTQTLKASNTVYDPIILDLDLDGFNVETKENGTNFDLDKNGFAEKINWTSKDGFLCLDLNNNGSIDNGGELFGDQTM